MTKKIYLHEQHHKLLTTKDKYYTRKDIDTYMSLEHAIMFPQIPAKKGIKQFGEREVAAMFKEYQQLDDGPIPGNPVSGTINDSN